jgi:SpoVK/Ycf46/Vps4 family AAA+-type ATPase
MYEAYSSNVCNTFILSGNIGDFTIGFYDLTQYLNKLFELEDCFNLNSIITFDIDKGGVQHFYNGQYTDKTMNFAEMCNKIENGTPSDKIAYIIKYPHGCIPSGEIGNMRYDHENNCIKLHRAITSRNFFRKKSIVIIIAESPNDINQMFLSSNIKSMTINIPLPNEYERRDFIELSMSEASSKRDFDSKVSLNEFARLTAGLTRISIEDIILQASKKNPITKQHILDKKAELIDREYGNIIEILDASDLSLEDFAGQEYVKAYFKDVVIDAIANNTIGIIPKGVLLMGPPGTGKSYFSRCLAGSAGINFVEFKMSKILDKYVGEAEKNLEKAFSVFRALAPVGVFIDELDQVLSRGNNDGNSVNKNLFGMFLAELSKPENRGKIIWLGATNYPNKIDEALKRTGRFDKKIPFFAPTEDERKLVFKKRIEKTADADKNIDYDNLARNTEGFTQAEIEGIVVKAFELARRKGSNIIRNEDLRLALEYICTAQNDRIKEMENIALLECNDVEFLTPEYRQRKIKLEKDNIQY